MQVQDTLHVPRCCGVIAAMYSISNTLHVLHICKHFCFLSPDIYTKYRKKKKIFCGVTPTTCAATLRSTRNKRHVF